METEKTRNVKTNIDNFIEKNDLKLLEIINLGNYRYHLRVVCLCGEEYITPYPKSTNKCKKCHDKYLQTKRRKKTYNSILKYVKENSSAKLLTLEEDFIDIKTMILFECECGNTFQTRFNDFKNQNKITCRECSNERLSKKLSLGIEGARKWIKENTTLILLSDFYKNNETLLKLKCHCGKEFETSIQLLKMGCNYECPECTIERRASHFRFDFEYVKRWIEESTTSKLLSTSYNNNSEKLILKCECGETYSACLMDLREGKNFKCRKCIGKVSKSEINTENFLKDNNVLYIKEHVFKDCKYKNYLPFDFYLPDKNITIELDGNHHYYVVNFGQGYEIAEEEFELRKIKDEIKTKYCQDNNIKLLRIPYWDFDKIETILKEHDII